MIDATMCKYTFYSVYYHITTHEINHWKLKTDTLSKLLISILKNISD